MQLIPNETLCDSLFSYDNSLVRYHDDGSKELNACIRFFLHMVYL